MSRVSIKIEFCQEYVHSFYACIQYVATPKNMPYARQKQKPELLLLKETDYQSAVT